MIEILFKKKLNNKVNKKILLLQENSTPNYSELNKIITKEECKALQNNDEIYYQGNHLKILRYKKNATHLDFQDLGGSIVNLTKDIQTASVFAPDKEIANVAFGFELGAYRFDKYKTSKSDKEKTKLKKVYFIGNSNDEQYYEFKILKNFRPPYRKFMHSSLKSVPDLQVAIPLNSPDNS